VISKEEDRKEIKSRFDDEFGGDGRGRTVVLSANADVKFLQWSPKDLDLSSLRDVPEERVSSVTGIPAAVLQFGTGLQQVKVGATMRELREMGWEGALIPFLEIAAETETEQTLPDFIPEGELDQYDVAWDLTKITALSGMQQRKADIEATLVRAGIKQVDEARLALGYPAVGGAAGGFQASPGVGATDTQPTNGGGKPPKASAEFGEDDDEDEDLSTRERQIAIHAGRGLSNKEIAGKLDLSERTVERHLATARAKLGIATRTQLGAWADRQ
jgi:DNA-binding CsgD family transcriptional regulator